MVTILHSCFVLGNNRWHTKTQIFCKRWRIICCVTMGGVFSDVVVIFQCCLGSTVVRFLQSQLQESFQVKFVITNLGTSLYRCFNLGTCLASENGKRKITGGRGRNQAVAMRMCFQEKLGIAGRKMLPLTWMSKLKNRLQKVRGDIFIEAYFHEVFFRNNCRSHQH